MVERDVGKDENWHCKLYKNDRKCLGNWIINVSRTLFNDTREYVDDGIINEGQSSFNEVH